jgi:hypothetical protein
MESTDGETPSLFQGEAGTQFVIFDGCNTVGGDPVGSSTASFVITEDLVVTAVNCVFSGKIARLRSTNTGQAATLILRNCGIPSASDYTPDPQWSDLIDTGASQKVHVTASHCFHADNHMPAYYRNAHWPATSTPVVLWSEEVDLTSAATQTAELGYQVVFLPVRVGVTLTAASGVTAQPYVSFGTSGSATALLGSTQTAGLAAANDNQSFTSLASYGGLDASDDLTATVVTGANATEMTGRFYWVGYILADQ